MERMTEEDRADFRATEGQAEVARLTRMHCVHGEPSGGVGGFSEDVDGQGFHGELRSNGRP